MATLNIISNFEMSTQGITHSGKQGLTTDAITKALAVTVTGTIHQVVGTLATATVITVYDDDSDFPVDFDYLFFWANQDLYVQLIGSAGNCVVKVEATVPWWLSGFDEILPAANTTLITGGTEPTMEVIDSVALGNYTGTSANYLFAVID